MSIISENLSLLQMFIILKTFSNENYLVGGCVRDILMNKKPKDFDIVTDINMDILEKELQVSGWSISKTGENFLIINAYKNNQRFEIANFRKDGIYLNGRQPESVEIGDINDDANRRDFTVNAIYYNPFSDIFIDPTSKGLEDIKNKTLRFIGRPHDRIKEDYLRVIRFYRFLDKGFVAHPKSLRACRELFADCIAKTKPERIREEIEKIVFK